MKTLVNVAYDDEARNLSCPIFEIPLINFFNLFKFYI